MSDPLDSFIFGLSERPKTSALVMEHGAFLIGLKKRAMDDLIEAAEPMPVSPYSVPVETFAQSLAQLVSHLLCTHLCAVYYSNVVRQGKDLSNELSTLTWRAKDDAAHMLRHLGGLGLVDIPIAPSPAPTQDVYEIGNIMIAKAERTIALLQGVRALAGDSPMRFTAQEMMGRWSDVLDNLKLCMPALDAEMGLDSKIARACKIARFKVAEMPVPGPYDVVAPPPGDEPPEAYLLREKQLETAQLANENDFLRQQLQQTQQHAAVQQTAAEQAGAQTQQLNQQLEQTQAEVQQAQQQAQQNMELASSAQSQAAAQADAKMRVSMRVQQLRQTLADLVSADPAAEEGAGFQEEAGPGGPMTSVQQQQQAEAEAQQAAAADPAAQQPPPAKAVEEAQQADRAVDEAQQQEAQAQQVGA